jgi:hypothetical protein
MRPSRFTVDPHILDNSDLSKVEVLRHWQHQISVLLEQIQSGIIELPPNPSSALYLDGTGNWSTPPTGTGGGGDMFKAIYDTNNNGVADTCDSLAYAKLTGVPASFTPIAHAPTHNHGGSDLVTPTYSDLVSVPNYVPGSAGTSAQVWSGTPGWTAVSSLPVAYSSLTGVPANFVPSAHAPTHLDNGTDPIAVVTTTRTGLAPKLSGSSAQFLNGVGTYTTPSVGAPPSSLTDLGSPAGNSTIDTAQAFVVAVNLKWTTAANWTLTLQNVVLGSTFYLRLLNNSGATRTFTITATNPSAASYTVTVLVPGSAPLSGAISINNGNALNVNGVSYTVGGNPTIQLFGFGSTG